MGEGEQGAPPSEIAEAIMDKIPALQKDTKLPPNGLRNASVEVLRGVFAPLILDDVQNRQATNGSMTPEAIVGRARERHGHALPPGVTDSLSAFTQPTEAPRDWNQEVTKIIQRGINHPLRRLSQQIVGTSPTIGKAMAVRAMRR